MEGASCSYSEPVQGVHSQRNPCFCSGRRIVSAPFRSAASKRNWRRESEIKHRYRAQQEHSRAKQRQCCASAGAVASYQLAQISSIPATSFDPRLLAILGGVAVFVLAIKKIFDTPSRTYDPNNPNVGDEYDSWTEEGILEHYWGEHIHLGYYSAEERARGYKKKDFKKAKFDFVDEMLHWSGAQQPQRILDVGCGIGGTSRHLASRFPNATVQGITLSPNQVARATELAEERGLTNVSFQVMNALNMEFEDDTFDLVWACESGEHMPDKKKYVEEMTRVLKPGGRMVIATWCQREETPEAPLTPKEKADLQFLYDEWAHPYFVSVQEYGRLLEGTGKLESVVIDDWTPQTLPTWRHSNWVGVWDPWPVILKFNPFVWYKVLREIVTLERMHRAFDSGLMEYGMAKAIKKGSSAPAKERATATMAAAA
ncbi:g6159 [Coccomyxa elongata]